MSEDGGEKDGVVYLGRSSFKMKVGVQVTPPAGTPAAPRATTPPPATTPPAMTIPPPVVKSQAPVPRSIVPYARTPVPPAQTSGGGSPTRTMIIGGLCMIAFSCGVMCTIAVDRLWPRERTQCVGAPPSTTGAVPAPAQGLPVIEAMEAPAASPVTTAVAPPPPADPMPPEPAPPAQAAPAAPAGKAAPAPAATKRSGPLGRVPPTQGRVMVRKRPGGAAPVSLETMSPTGIWVDPFAE